MDKTREEFLSEYRSEHPSWATQALPQNIRTPSAERIAFGWVVEQPTHTYFNWHMNRTDRRLSRNEALLAWLEGVVGDVAASVAAADPAAAQEQQVALSALQNHVKNLQALVAEQDVVRRSFIGVVRENRSTSLPGEGYVIPDGSFVRFDEYPELREVFNTGGLSGSLIAWDAAASVISANPLKWRPDAAIPTGLYVPNKGASASTFVVYLGRKAA